MDDGGRSRREHAIESNATTRVGPPQGGLWVWTEQLPRVQGGIKACHSWLLDSATAPCVALPPASLQSSGNPCRNDEFPLTLRALLMAVHPKRKCSSEKTVTRF
jgi:hypothetical protein